MARETMALTGGNAGERPPAPGVVGSLACSSLALPMQPQGSKRAPLPESGVLSGRGGGDRPYVHTPIGTSPAKVFEGTTAEGIEKIRKSKRFKQVMEVAFQFAKADEQDLANAILSCGRYFRRVNFPCGTYKLIPFPCDSIFCPSCAARRSLPLQNRIIERMNPTVNDYWHLVITVQSWLTLTASGLKNLISQFAELRASGVWKEEVTGGVYSIEVTFNRDNQTWHPHLHVLIETPKRLPMNWIERLKMEWRGITNGSHVMRLEKMYGVDKKGNKRGNVNARSVRELAKYATKALTFSDRPGRVMEFYNAFKNVRRVQSFGSFIGMVKEAEKDAEKAHESEPVGCKCGMCIWAQGEVEREIVHISKTFLTSEGLRQVKLFELDTGPPPEPEKFLSQEFYEQTRALAEIREEASRQATLFPVH
jgi:hypothetical protein